MLRREFLACGGCLRRGVIRPCLGCGVDPRLVIAQAETTYVIDQRTLASYLVSSASLGDQQRVRVHRAVAASPDAEKFTYTGIRLEGQSTPLDVV